MPGVQSIFDMVRAAAREALGTMGDKPENEPPAIRVFGPVPESFEFRRTHYRIYDEDGFARAFAIGAPEWATLASVSAHVCERFDGTGGTGYESKDLVILLGPRIIAVVRKGSNGQPVFTHFAE
jgi:hypothetical protein